MTNLWIHPAMVIMIGALLLPFIPRSAAVLKSYLVTVPVLAFLSVLFMEVPEQGAPALYHGQYMVIGWKLTFGRVDPLSNIFGHIMTLMCVIGTIYGLHVKDIKEHMAAWLYVAVVGWELYLIYYVI